MIKKLIELSVKNKFIVLLLTTGLIVWGINSIRNIPIDAVPDITNNQVQILTTSRNLSTQDVEQYITYPVELEMANLPGVTEIRSVSKFGLSVVTVVFTDEIGTYKPRQLIAEKLISAQENIPAGFGVPTMGPITTGLGEIVQYTIDVRPGYEGKYSLTDLRTIHDWVIKRQLSGIPGVVEVNTWGGKLKQYEVAVDPVLLNQHHLTIGDVFTAIENNNSVSGGGYIERNKTAYFIRGEGVIGNTADIENIVVTRQNGVPVYVKNLAKVQFGSATRFGAITANGEGEKVMGQIMLLKDANTGEVIEAAKERIAEVQKRLPEGIYINPFLERTELIDKTIFTVIENLVLGALIVILVVILLLGNLRAGLVIASLIPLALLFAISMMNVFGISANLMSLGAVDFGIIIDGVIIIVEFVLLSMSEIKSVFSGLNGEELQQKKDEITIEKSSKMMHSAIFGQLIILIVFIPILALTGVEGKMFGPMAITFCFALIGAMILSLTYVPVMAALVLKPDAKEMRLSKWIVESLERAYLPVINMALNFKKTVIGIAVVWLAFAFFLFQSIGGEFIPTLDEGDLVIQPIIPTGTSLSETIEICTDIENILLDNFPEVDQVVSRIGAAEVPTDPMSMEEPDVIIKLKPKSEWVSTDSKDELIEMINEKLSVIPGVGYEYTQPIEMRFNELITGVRADVAIKIYGEDLSILADKADEVKTLISGVAGAEDISVEKTEGLPQMLVKYDRQKIAEHGLNIYELNQIVEMGFGGAVAGSVFEGEKRFDIVVRHEINSRDELSDLSDASVRLHNGDYIPLNELATVEYADGPAKISRDDTKRRIVIGVNVRDRDMQSVVTDIQNILDKDLKLPPGYTIEYGGQFENMKQATDRLAVVVPIALVMIFFMLYLTFNSIKNALLIFAAIPLAATGGVLLLWLRDLPFSISAGVGFIALFGIAVLNGIVLIEHYRGITFTNPEDFKQKLMKATKQRMRPVLMTASAAALGFFPMAISASSGAEVQRPLATVVIGGLITATLLTLIVIPVLYSMLANASHRRHTAAIALLVVGIMSGSNGYSQTNSISMQDAVQMAISHHPMIKEAQLNIDHVSKQHKSELDADMLSVSYTYGQINAGSNDYQLNVSQQFHFPTVYLARRKVGMKKTELANQYLKLNERDLTFEVQSSYATMVYLMQSIELLQSMKSNYRDYASYAQKRIDAGDGTPLDLSLAQMKIQEIDLQLSQLQNQLQSNSENFQLLLNSDEVVLPEDTSLVRYALPAMDTSQLSGNLQMQYFDQAIELSEQNHRYSKSGFIPDLTVGYTNQQIEGISNLSSFMVGINIPIFYGEKTAEVKSAKLESEMLRSKRETELLDLYSTYNQLNSDLTLSLKSLDYYESTGLQTAKQLLDVATKSYQEGEISYVEFLTYLEKSTTIHRDYLTELEQYNQLTLKMNYLIGK